MMSHDAAGMTGMEDPSKRFGEIVIGNEDPRKMLHDKIFLLAPLLDGKLLDVNVLSTGSGMLFIDHVESSHIVNEQMCWTGSKSVKCCEDAAKTLGDLSTSQRRVKLCFSQTGGNHSPDATLPCNGGKAEEHNKSSYGAAGLEVIGMSCIKAANQLIPKDEGEWRKVRIFFQERKRDVRKIIER